MQALFYGDPNLMERELFTARINLWSLISARIDEKAGM